MKITFVIAKIRSSPTGVCGADKKHKNFFVGRTKTWQPPGLKAGEFSFAAQMNQVCATCRSPVCSDFNDEVDLFVVFVNSPLKPQALSPVCWERGNTSASHLLCINGEIP